MTSLTYGEFKLLICLHGNRNKQGGHVIFDVASGPFKWPGNASMWPPGTLKNPFRTLKKKKRTE